MSWCKPLIVGVFLTILTGCNQSSIPEKPLMEAQGKTMGTFYHVKIVGDYPGGQQALQSQVDALLKHYNDMMSTYDPNSELSKLNQYQQTTAYPISQDMADLLINGLRTGQQTGGLLDMTVGPLVNLWGFGPDKRPIKTPTDAAIEKARERVGIDKVHVEVSSDHAVVRKDHPDISIDLSTFGEGFGADKVAAMLEGKGVHDYLVEIAGASRSRGLNPKGQPWRLAIQKPNDEIAEVQAIIQPDGRAVSTSGSYRNYYELDGHRYSHVIDPRTGKPITHKLVSATVITATALEADSLDTALMVMGPDNAMSFANKEHLAVYLVVKTATGFEARYSDTFKPFLVKQ
jgi:thiamine biosynthesis lipoprotein